MTQTDGADVAKMMIAAGRCIGFDDWLAIHERHDAPQQQSSHEPRPWRGVV